MPTTIAPAKITLTCKVTGKQTTWLNKALIQKAIDKHGSLEAFMDGYVSREGKGQSGTKKPQGKTWKMKPVLEEGVKMGKMGQEEYEVKYVTRVHTYQDGTSCTVRAPAPRAAVFGTEGNTHAGTAALKAVAGSLEDKP